MATSNTATITTLHQPRPMTAAERQRACRARKKAAEVASAAPAVAPATRIVAPAVTQPRVTKPVTRAVTVSHAQVAPWLLTITAIGLACVGIVMNGWFAHSLGSTEVASWLFCAIGIAADLLALGLPTVAARRWQDHQRPAALAAWAIWLATFAFVCSAGVGFASLNVTDVTASRAGRVTPAIVTAKAALSDAMTSRDNECKGGVGKYCRAREDAVTERRRDLDVAMQAVASAADPQTQAASKIVAWLSGGWLRPGSDDIAMLRLILLAMLPQLGGIVLMIGRSAR